MDSLRIHPFLDGLVAGQTEIRAGSEQQVLQFGLVGIMALGALAIGYRRMGAARLLQVALQSIVTGKTESCLLINQHAGDGTAVGIMTDLAVPFTKGRVQGVARFCFHQAGMAFPAQLCADCTEDLRNRAAMGDMAGAALAVSYRPMGIGLIEIGGLLHVAGIADRIHPFLQDFIVVGAMGIMTDGTITLFIRRMLDAGLVAGIQSGGMAAETKGAAFVFQQFLLIGGMGGMTGDTGLLTCHWGMGKGNLGGLGVMTFYT
jgi:hypothetical protein